jgi:hypothetical protein
MTAATSPATTRYHSALTNARLPLVAPIVRPATGPAVRDDLTGMIPTTTALVVA